MLKGVAAVLAVTILAAIAAAVWLTRTGPPSQGAPPQHRSSVTHHDPAPQSLLGAARSGPAQGFQPTWRAWPTDRFATAYTDRMAGNGKLGDRLPGPAAATANDVLTFHPPYGARDARSFTSGPWMIVLAGVEGPDRDSICLDASEAPFACGLHARAALTNAVAQAVLTCRVRGAVQDEVIEADCQSPQGDLAALLVQQGWLRPQAQAAPTEAVAAAARAASDARLGMWAGGWRYRSPSP